MHAVLRRYRVRLGTVGEAAVHAERSLLPLIKQLPGFVAHYLLDTGGGIAVSLTLFETKTAAEASHRVLTDWFRSDWPAFQQIPPDVPVGEVVMLETTRRETRARERRNGSDRRASERRQTLDRRTKALPILIERRTGTDRRMRLDRRSGVERRADWAPPLRSGPEPQRRRIAPPWRRREPFHSR